MRRISLSNGEIWATNSRDGGVFLLKNGNYKQLAGNGQTPFFRSKAHFRDYIRNRFDVRYTKIISSYGW